MSARLAARSRRPPAEPVGSGAPGTGRPRIDITSGNHLLVLGISTPVGYQVAGDRTLRVETDGASSPVETELLPTPWPDHFTVIGIRSRAPDGSLPVWPAGRLPARLETEPGGDPAVDRDPRSGAAVPGVARARR